MDKITKNYCKVFMVTFNIIETQKRKKDIEKALKIYLSAIDIETSYTNTNEIKHHILSGTKDEKRKLFFYNLYLNDQLFGFAEFGYLPDSETLVIDYICTEKRNPCAFYNFYQLCIEEISKSLSKQKRLFKYIITEISLTQNNGLYCDVDSNYFRKLLSIDNYVLLKYPYYQPSFDHKHKNFAIAIKSASGSSVNSPLTCEEYLSIIDELYNFHYGTWYKKYYSEEEVNKVLKKLSDKIKKEILPQKNNNNNISLVNCPVFEAGNCQNVNIEPITFTKKIKKSIINVLLISFWLIVTVASCFLVIFNDIQYINVISLFISAVSGIITIAIYLRSFFRN